MKSILNLIAVFVLLLPTFAGAQELNARVNVRFERIQGVDPKIFEGLETALFELLNNRRWTEDNYKPFEKIDCSFLLNITKRSGNNYSGALTIQASRPVFNSAYTSPIVNFMDRDITFKYELGQVLQFDEQRVAGNDAYSANLTAIFAFYANYILGLHYDSFQQGGGTEYFKKAQNIVLNAPEDGNSIAGWKANDGNAKNRYWLVDQVLNARFDGFRPYYYTYHRYGLDMMAEQPEAGRQGILDGLTVLEQINQQNPSSILLQFFFNAKSGEYINLLKSIPENERQKYAAILAKLDVPNASKYNDAR